MFLAILDDTVDRGFSNEEAFMTFRQHCSALLVVLLHLSAGCGLYASDGDTGQTMQTITGNCSPQYTLVADFPDGRHIQRTVYRAELEVPAAGTADEPAFLALACDLQSDAGTEPVGVECPVGATCSGDWVWPEPAALCRSAPAWTTEGWITVECGDLVLTTAADGKTSLRKHTFRRVIVRLLE